MNKYKVCAYAICKNEEQFVESWYDHVKEADLVIVGDTGSTDNTVSRLRELGATVYSLDLEYFRFDTARNKCLELIPDDVDICVSSDLDEIISYGWRDKLEGAWKKDTTRGVCNFNWSHNADGTPGVTYLHQRIHSRHNYVWLYPTHEIVSYIGNSVEKEVFIEGMVYDHYPDTTKSRSFNLKLLQLAIEENPDKSRNYHYLGREYMFMERWEDCINTLTKQLSLPDSGWKEERAASMRFISRAYKGLKDIHNSKIWLYKAIAEQPLLREPYLEMAMLSEDLQDWLSMYYYAIQALNITNRPIGYSSEAFSYDSTPYDLLAISSYWLGMRENALKYSKLDLSKDPYNERLLNNHKLYNDVDKFPTNNFK